MYGVHRFIIISIMLLVLLLLLLLLLMMMFVSRIDEEYNMKYVNSSTCVLASIHVILMCISIVRSGTQVRRRSQ